MSIEQGASAEFVAAHLDGGRGARVLVRRGGPLQPRQVVLAWPSERAAPGLYRVGRMRDGAVELLPAAGEPAPPSAAPVTSTAAVIGTLLVCWQCEGAQDATLAHSSR